MHRHQHWRRALRYRLLSYRYALVMRVGQTGPFGDLWQTDRLRLQAKARWRPDADTYETATTRKHKARTSATGVMTFRSGLLREMAFMRTPRNR